MLIQLAAHAFVLALELALEAHLLLLRRQFDLPRLVLGAFDGVLPKLPGRLPGV
jgi:hypothetical protein